MSKTNAHRVGEETAFTAETTGTEHCPRVCNICTFPEVLGDQDTNSFLYKKKKKRLRIQPEVRQQSEESETEVHLNSFVRQPCFLHNIYNQPSNNTKCRITLHKFKGFPWLAIIHSFLSHLLRSESHTCSRGNPK